MSEELKPEGKQVRAAIEQYLAAVFSLTCGEMRLGCFDANQRREETLNE